MKLKEKKLAGRVFSQRFAEIESWLLLIIIYKTNTVQKMKFSITDVFSKLSIWSHLLKKSVMENLIFCAVSLHMYNFCSNYREEGGRA